MSSVNTIQSLAVGDGWEERADQEFAQDRTSIGTVKIAEYVI